MFNSGILKRLSFSFVLVVIITILFYNLERTNEYWYMFPIAVVIAIICNSSGFSGGVLFQPIYYFVMRGQPIAGTDAVFSIRHAVATGIATETVGMTSGALRYIWYKMAELPIGFTMILLTIPGVVIGNHAMLVVNENVLKLVLGIVMLVLASIQLFSAVKNYFGTRENLSVEDIYGYMWVPPLGGFFSSSTGTGICELSQPVLEKGLKLKTKKANATAILIEATADWVITILNLQAGFIVPYLWLCTGTGVIIGGQIGPYLSRFLPERLLKIVFSIGILVIGVFCFLYRVDFPDAKLCSLSWVPRMHLFC